jgi:tetratricopeptide (TPR) repeat protein
MKLAVESGVTGEEGTEWTRVQLGHLYENTGDLRQAEMQYATSANARPGYAPALAGLGRVAKARKDYARAIEYFQQCDSLQKDYTYKEELSDLYQLTGDTQKANALAQEVVKEMTQEASAANSDPAAGHYVDKELAYAYLRINNTDKALEHALAEYNRRPDNIDVNETLAWVYYKRNQYKEAQHYIQKALRTHSKNPVLLERARMIGEMIDGRW